MNMNFDLPEKYRKIIEELKQLYSHYGKYNTVPPYVNYEKIEEEINIIYNYFKEEYGDKLEEDMVKERLIAISKSAENSLISSADINSNLLVYDFIRNVYNKMDDIKDQNYHCQLIETYFQQFQKDIPPLTKEQFENLVKIFTSYIKLENVINQIRQGITPTKICLTQLYECILYPRLSREDCHQIIFNKIESKYYKFISYEFKPLGEGTGFLGDHFILEINIIHENIDRKMCFFTKFVPKKNTVWDKLALRGFKKEDFIYMEMIPLLKKYGVTNLSDFAPKCYFSRQTDVIVLEDLTPYGFTFLNMDVPAKFDWMVRAIQELSKFHACSILLEQKLSKQSGKEVLLQEIYSEYLKEIFFEKNGIMDFEGNLVNEYFLEEQSEIYAEMPIDEFKRILRTKSSQIFENVKSSEKYYNVICHGDIYGRNILTNDNLDCILIDFQLIRYCPPAVDLLFLIYISSSRELRSKYMEKFIEMYYNCLKNNLHFYDIDINQFYTWDNFCESINFFKFSAIIQVLQYLQTNVCPLDTIKTYKNVAEISVKFYHDDKNKHYRSKIRGLVKDLYYICKDINSV